MARITEGWQQKQVDDYLELLETCCSIEEIVNISKNLIALSDQRWYVERCWPAAQKAVESVRGDNPRVYHVAIDVSQYMQAAWHATKGDMQEAVEVTLGSLQKVERAMPGNSIVWLAMDPLILNWRKQKYPQYKGGRPDKDPGYIDFMEKVEDVLHTLPYQKLRVDGYEADDIIASIAAQAAIAGDKTIMVTNDIDCMQMLSASTTSWKKGVFFSKDKLFEEVGIRPSQVVDYLCLLGNDDVPGVDGIGKVTASELLSRYGNVTTIYENVTEIDNSKMQEAIREYFLKNYWNVREIHTLKRTLDLPWDVHTWKVA